MEHKALPVEIKASGPEGIVTAYVSTYGGEPDHQGDVVLKGAFSKSLEKMPNPRILWQHDQNEPIGRWKSWEEDDHGLKLTGKLSMGTQKGREAFELLKDGVIDQFSIGYEINDSDMDTKSGVRTLKDLTLWEASPVTFPANELATLVGVKSAEKSEPDLAGLQKAIEDLVENVKAGSRNSAADQSRVQVTHDMLHQAHDHTVGLGATCSAAQVDADELAENEIEGIAKNNDQQLNTTLYVLASAVAAALEEEG